ncbi:hypothetical protein [Dyella lutea]|uniref:RDD family protein n=1 Tax=Dyella lutea TaxID=2950441 RepID=A0ABT1F569_9GAMM|nr:hypothetical protein [Dyella lutea]MCP1372534.1 hypothetical protein [Dyella lutea]
MSTHDEWSDWAAQWRTQPVVDIERLRRRTLAKRWRMLAMVVFETVTAIGALVQTGWLFAHPGLGLRWKLFATGGTVLVVVMWSITLWLRRGTWRAAGSRVAELLRLDARRARAGIRLAQAQLWGFAALLVGVAVLAWPSLQPSAWMHDEALRRLLLVQIGANAPIVLGGVVFCLWYIRRQRRRLARIAQLTAELGMV